MYEKIKAAHETFQKNLTPGQKAAINKLLDMKMPQGTESKSDLYKEYLKTKKRSV